MQKIMLCLAKPDKQDSSIWNPKIEQWANSLAKRFHACSYTLKDAHVADAHLLEMRFTTHPKDAIISLWADHAHDLDDVYAAAEQLGEFQAYGVMESAAIAIDFKLGRVEGMCQVALIKKPETLPRPDWLNAWLGDHTRVAIDTQSNFAYRQNVVAVPQPLKSAGSASWPLMDAIVEENFPAIAMTSREAFFAAEGDPEKFEEHQQIMMQSCAKFIDFEAFDCVPMSHYMVKNLS